MRRLQVLRRTALPMSQNLPGERVMRFIPLVIRLPLVIRPSFVLRFALGVLLAGGTVLAQAPPTGSLDIDLGAPQHTVSPTLYGLMTEEINFSYDGGLYAE